MAADLIRARRYAALGIAILLGAALRAWGLLWGLYNANIETRPHPDEWVVYWVPRWFARHSSLNPCPQPQHQCFFDWGSLYIDITYAAQRAFHPVLVGLPASAFGPHADRAFVTSVLAGRAISACLSTLVIVAVFFGAQAAFGGESGLVAAFATALSALPIQLAHFATPDSTVMLLVSVTLICLLLAVRDTSSRWLVASGIPAGLALGTEYHMALLAVPIAAAWWLSGRHKPLLLAGALTVMGACYLVTNPYALLDWGSFLNAMHHTLLIRTVDSSAEYQGRFQQYGPDWLYIVRFALAYGMGLALTCLTLGALAWALFSHTRLDALLLSWIIPYGLLESVSSAKFMRYSEPLLPALLILVGGFAWRVLAMRSRSARPLAWLVLAAAAVYTCMYVSAYTSLFARSDARAVATAWVQRTLAPGTPVAFEQLPNGLINLPYFVSSSAHPPCFAQFRTRWSNDARYVLTDQYALEEHPRIPAAQVARFRELLLNRGRFRLAERVHYEPSILGLTFSIDGSPHDWRYPSRNIAVYRNLGPLSRTGQGCFRTIAEAVDALYTGHRAA